MAIYVSPKAGTRNTPKDALIFVRGTTATFKITFESNGNPTTVDTGTDPVIKVYQPRFLENDGFTNTDLLFSTTGSLVSGQQYEYEFQWTIPTNLIPSDEYIVSYEAYIGGTYLEYGDELFTIQSGPGQVGIKNYGYATVDDIRTHHFSIDSFLPEKYADETQQYEFRNKLIETHIVTATEKLQEELSLFKARSNSVNYKLFVIFYSIYSILAAARGQDGSSVSDSNLNMWKQRWQEILAQEKREGSMQSIGLGRG